MADKPATDSAATVDSNGKLSNARLHEQMTEGVDDEDFRQQTRRWLLAEGLPESVVDSVIAPLP